MTTTTTTVTTAQPTANYADLISRLKARQAALGDVRDLRSENERAAYAAAYNTIQGWLTTLANAGDLAVATARLAAATAERDAWLAKQAELTAEVAAFKDWRLVALNGKAGNARERDEEYERQRDIRRRLERLHRGTLYSGPGTTYGTLDPLEQRVAELTTRLASVRSRLDAAVAEAEASLQREPVTS